jgi:NAD(P)-dependent dehydrogenase (short-subunit alcohol dehydrogenase family)
LRRASARLLGCIRVNAISPGAIHTPIWDKLCVPAEMRQATSARIPFGRFGTSEEVAEVVDSEKARGPASATSVRPPPTKQVKDASITIHVKRRAVLTAGDRGQARVCLV